MAPKHGGLLDSDSWSDLSQDLSTEEGFQDKLRPAWAPSASSSRSKTWNFGKLSSLIGDRRPSKPDFLRPTAYLDGLRGFAALIVYWHHHELWVHGKSGQNNLFENGFGYDGQYPFVALPIVRNFFTGGHFAVSTFFVISGYVLSLKPLGLVQRGQQARLGDAVASALFRRWFRLFLPLVLTMLPYVISRHAFGYWIDGVARQGNLRHELWHFYCEFKNFSFVFLEGGPAWFSYNFHLWSIPVEFKGSIVIYTTAIALSRCTQKMRLWCEVGLLHYFMYIVDGWYCAMFMAGMILCDLDLLSKMDELPRFVARLAPLKTFIAYHGLFLSLFLGGVPSENSNIEQLAKTRGWYYLSLLKPQAVFDYKWYYLLWAAATLVAVVPHISWLKSFFETRFCQHLGRISFALYMVHGPVLWTIGDRVYLATGWETAERAAHMPRWNGIFPLPKAGPLGLEVSFLVPQMVLLPLTLGVAELVTRWIDTPCLRFAAWLHAKATEEEPEKMAKA